MAPEQGIDRQLRVAQIGNFGPEHSTENELLHAMLVNEIQVSVVQEGSDDLMDLLSTLRTDPEHFDFILWTSTKSLRDQWGSETQWQFLATARKAGVPVIGYHLDRWWGLQRQGSLDDIYFQCDLMVTADGGHDDMWATKNINHAWLPPAVSERWCHPGTFRDEYACDIVFVGNWSDYAHYEWTHRPELIEFLTANYPRRGSGSGFRALPRRGQPAIRGFDLCDVYASATLAIGDSCLVPRADGRPAEKYVSDRVPETMGRAACLIHPYVEGVTGFKPNEFPHYSWALGDWEGLRGIIDVLLADPDAVAQARASNLEHIKANHTYTMRIAQLVTIMTRKGLL